MSDESKIGFLLVKYLEVDLSLEESIEFEAWIGADPVNRTRYRSKDILRKDFSLFKMNNQINKIEACKGIRGDNPNRTKVRITYSLAAATLLIAAVLSVLLAKNDEIPSPMKVVGPQRILVIDEGGQTGSEAVHLPLVQLPGGRTSINSLLEHICKTTGYIVFVTGFDKGIRQKVATRKEKLPLMKAIGRLFPDGKIASYKVDGRTIFIHYKGRCKNDKGKILHNKADILEVSRSSTC